MINYVSVSDLEEKILFNWQSERYLGCIRITTDSQTVRKYVEPEKWMSIGVFNEDWQKYRAMWDVYAPTPFAKKVIQNRVKYACLRLGGLYAKGFV